MTTTEIVKDWTWQELQRELLVWQGIELGRSQFFHWLPFALIEPKGIYTNRDRRKLLMFGHFMKRYKRLELAKEKLIEHMQTYPEKYPDD